MPEQIVDTATLEELEAILGRDNLVRVVEIQIRHSDELAVRLEAMSRDPEAGEVRFLAHKIAGASGSLGLVPLAALALDIERRADGATGRDELATLSESLHRLLVRSNLALRTLFPEIV